MRRSFALTLVAGLTIASCSADSQGLGEQSEELIPVDVEIIDDYVAAEPQVFDVGLDGQASELALARASNDGQLPVQVALDLLASVLGDIPGAEPRFTETSIHDGTMALNTLRAHWDQLSPEQIEAIENLLTPQRAETAQIDGTDVELIAFSVTHSDEAAAMALVNAAEAEIARHLGSLGVPIVVEFTSADTAVAFPRSGGINVEETGAAFDECVVQFPSEFSANDAAHEVFHCFQYAVINLPTQDWIIEGSAEWVGARVGGADASTENLFVEWIASVDSLFDMDYQALGYYWTIETLGADPWATIVQMLDQRNEAAIAASGLDPSEVLRRMGSAQWRNAVSPAPVDDIWDFSAPDVPLSGGRGLVVVSPENPLSETASRGPFGTMGPLVISLDGSFVDIDISAEQGSLQFFGMDLVLFEGNHTKRYCLNDAACACAPEGEELERGSNTLAASTEVSAGGVMTYSVMTEWGDMFPNGSWQGELVMSTSEVLTLPGGKLTADQLGGPFTLTVVDGVVTEGAYSVKLAQHMDMDDGFADVIGTLTGSIVGCASAPQLLSESITIDGTITNEGGTRPMSFTQAVGGAGGSLILDMVEDDAVVVTGRLPNEPYLDYMRSVGVGVNDFSISFVATLVS